MPHLEPIELTGQHRSVLLIPVRLTPHFLLPVRAKRSRSNTRMLCPVDLLCPISFIRQTCRKKSTRIFHTPGAAAELLVAACKKKSKLPKSHWDGISHLTGP